MIRKSSSGQTFHILGAIWVRMALQLCFRPHLPALSIRGAKTSILKIDWRNHTVLIITPPERLVAHTILTVCDRLSGHMSLHEFCRALTDLHRLLVVSNPSLHEAGGCPCRVQQCFQATEQTRPTSKGKIRRAMAMTIDESKGKFRMPRSRRYLNPVCNVGDFPQAKNIYRSQSPILQCFRFRNETKPKILFESWSRTFPSRGILSSRIVYSHPLPDVVKSFEARLERPVLEST